MFDPKRFIAACREACAGRAALPAVREIVARAVREPAEVMHALGEPTRAGAQVLYRAADLTVFNLIWGPRMIQLPHDHAMWAVIGIYTGREDNVFGRRLPREAARGIETAGAKTLVERPYDVDKTLALFEESNRLYPPT